MFKKTVCVHATSNSSGSRILRAHLEANNGQSQVINLWSGFRLESTSMTENPLDSSPVHCPHFSFYFWNTKTFRCDCPPVPVPFPGLLCMESKADTVSQQCKCKMFISETGAFIRTVIHIRDRLGFPSSSSLPGTISLSPSVSVSLSLLPLFFPFL